MDAPRIPIQAWVEGRHAILREQDQNMAAKTIWIEIAREWIEFALVSRGRLKTIHRILVDPPDQSNDEASLPNLRQNISHGLSVLNAPKANVNVLWHAHGASVDLQSVSVPPAAAPDAAILAFSAANALDPNEWTLGAAVATERNTRQGSSSVIVAALKSSVLAEIEHAIAEAGGTLIAAIPAQAASMRHALRHAVDQSASGAHAVCIHLAEEAATIAIAANGEILLARAVEMGYATLREAYIRAIQADHASRAEAFLAANKRLLKTEGIPTPKGQPEAMAIFQTARPFIQRLFIEIKQTIRFTLEESEMLAAQVRVIGPGASIPRLPQLLADEVGLENVEAVPLDRAAGDPGAGITEALDVDATELALQPPGQMRSRKRTARRAALIYGAVAATLLLAGDIYLANQSIDSLERRTRQATQDLDEIRSRTDTGRGLNPQAQSNVLETLIRNEAALAPDWGAALAELSRARPEAVGFTSISGERGRDGSTLDVSAFVLTETPDDDPHQHVNGFLERLNASDLFADVTLGSTEQMDGRRSMLRFSLSIHLNEIQARWLTAEVAQ